MCLNAYRSPNWAKATSLSRFLSLTQSDAPHARAHTHKHTHTHITIGGTPLYKRSARRRGRYLNNIQQTQETNIHTPSSEFEPTVPEITWPLTYALDRTANGIALLLHYWYKNPLITNLPLIFINYAFPQLVCKILLTWWRLKLR
jgi:hypothetical protein